MNERVKVLIAYGGSTYADTQMAERAAFQRGW
jgi:hypothetical protein